MSKIENEIKKENMREDILEEFDSNLTDKDLSSLKKKCDHYMREKEWLEKH